ncbi:MAG: methyltransferase [Microbacteriaceae bacterium]|nr:methyltransferase [Microbacteriaceae bacterium]
MDAAGAAAALVVGADSVTGAPGAVPAAELPVPDAVAARFADDPVLEVVMREAIATGDEPGHLPPTIAIVDADQDFVDAARMLGAVDVRAFSDSTVAPLDGAVASGLDAPLLAGASLVVGRLPKSLAELAALADAVARLAEPGVRLILGARQQHLVRAMNDELGRSFAHVRASRGMRKSRALVASGPEPGDPPLRTGRIPELDLQVRALGGAFAGAALDLGTRVLLEAIDPAMRAASRVRHDPAGLWNPASEPRVVLDLGSGTGVLAAWAKRRWPRARVIATDRSWFACESTRATASANGLDIETVRADAADAIADASVDLVLCNPPFHDGRGVDRGMANRLFDAAGRVLRPGGDMVTVFNSHLRHREQLQRRVGHTRQLLRTPKFTVTLSERR